MQIENLSFRYKGTSHLALDDIDITIPQGQFTVITGPSGCGKSTFLRSLNGLIPHFYEGDYSGTVNVDGKIVAETPPRFLAVTVGSIFQFPEDQMVARTVERDVAFGLENLAIPPDLMEERITTALEYVGLQDCRETSIHTLSGGQQQRLAIASVLAMEPGIILLDEPTAELDPNGAREILQILKHLHEDGGKTIVLVEHRLDEVLPLAD
ncbi:MAG: ABC transporter ATP-binding protein [Candidatus Ranarchaeia archaeon]